MDATAIPQEAPEAGLGLHPVLARTRHVDELPSYVVPDTDLEMGASLGNSSCWVTTKGTGDVESVFSTFLGQKVLGAICVRYSGTGRRLQRPFQEGGVQPTPNGARKQDGQIQLYSQAPGRFEIHPAFQRHDYELPGNVQVEETVFVPTVTTPLHAHEHMEMESPLIYQIVRLRSRAALPVYLRVYGYAQMQGATSADLSATYDPSLGQGALVARNQSKPDWVRIFGVSGLQVRVARWETSFDDRQIYETTNVSQLHNDTSASGSILGALQVDIELQPGESTQFAFVTAFSHEGEGKARQIFNAGLDFNYALGKTVEYYNHVAEVSQVLTPDPRSTWASPGPRSICCASWRTTPPAPRSPTTPASPRQSWAAMPAGSQLAAISCCQSSRAACWNRWPRVNATMG